MCTGIHEILMGVLTSRLRYAAQCVCEHVSNQLLVQMSISKRIRCPLFNAASIVKVEEFHPLHRVTFFSEFSGAVCRVSKADRGESLGKKMKGLKKRPVYADEEV